MEAIIGMKNNNNELFFLASRANKIDLYNYYINLNKNISAYNIVNRVLLNIIFVFNFNIKISYTYIFKYLFQLQQN